jgi:hypothetical protein
MVQPQLHVYVPGYSTQVLQRSIEQQQRSSKRQTTSDNPGTKLATQFWDQVQDNLDND